MCVIDTELDTVRQMEGLSRDGGVIGFNEGLKSQKVATHSGQRGGVLKNM